MKILALETSTRQSSVAVLTAGHVHQCFITDASQQAVNLQPLIAEILTQENLLLSQLDAIAYSAGPGSFTGLRVGAAFSQGLAYAHNLPVIQVPSLQVWAQAAYEKLQCDRVLVAVDAKMQQIYWGIYQVQQKIMQPVQADQLINPKEVVIPKNDSWIAVGDAWKFLDHHMENLTIKEDIVPQADIVAKLASYYYSLRKFTPLESVGPFYLRGQEAWKKTNS